MRSVGRAYTMDQYETNSHPFVVKVWLEESAEETGRAKWRGHITHVPSGERRYLENLACITHFIARYLAEMGVRPCLWMRVNWWINQLCGTSGLGSKGRSL